VHDSNFALANSGLCNSFWKKYEITSFSYWLKSAERYCLLALSQDKGSVSAYRSIGIIYRDTGRLQKAIEFIEIGYSLDNDDAATMIELASVYDLLGDKNKAENLYSKAIVSTPKNWRVFDAYAYYLTRNGKYEDAIDVYKKVLSLTPDNIFALNNIGINFLFKNDFKSAASAFEQASKLEPSSSVFVNTGSMYYFSGDYNKAVYMFERALDLEPDNYQWMVYVADSYKFISGKKNKADEYFRMAIEFAEKESELDPSAAKAYQYLARSFCYLGNIEKAKSLLRDADKFDASSIDAYYAHLRVAVVEYNEDYIRKYVQALLAAGYSEDMLLADPDLSILKHERYVGLFK